MLAQLNSPVLYAICGAIIVFVAIVCVIFMVRAYKMGIAIGMDRKKMNTTITSSATFVILPSIGILLGVIALSGTLGTPLPWLRLSVIGALHYETQVAQAASEAAGLTEFSISQMTGSAFATIALLMSFCIIWGMVLSIFFTKKYSNKLTGQGKSGKSGGGMMEFGNVAMTAMFIGLVSAYIASYIGEFVSKNGLLTFTGSLLPLGVAVVAAIVMAIFLWIKEKFHAEWIEGFAIAGSMLISMASALVLNKVL